MKPAIYVVADHDGHEAHASTLELITLSRNLSSARECDITAVVMGADPTRVGDQMAGFVPRVLVATVGDLPDARPEHKARVLAKAIDAEPAAIVLVSGSKSGVVTSSRLAARIGSVLLEDVTSLGFDGDRLLATRLSFLSRIAQSIRASYDRAVVSVRRGVTAQADEASTKGRVEAFDHGLDERDRQMTVRARSGNDATNRVALEAADIVVTGGRGLGTAAAFNRLVVPLAEALGGGIGATRAVVDSGWRPYHEQVGQTGRSVAPRVYLAIAVSGAVQHLSGINRSHTIIAINNDRDAPIVSQSDIAVIGDAHEIVPALLEVLQGNSNEPS